MAEERKPIPCPECNREKYFEGLCYWCKQRKKRERYQIMTDTQIEGTIGKIIDEIETIKKWKEVYNDFCGLLAYRDINTKEIGDAAFQKNIFYPPTIYRNASSVLQDKLIEILLQSNCTDANHILMCLAVCGGDKVREVFLELEKNPLPWREKLHVNPSVYAECGGWSFDEKGNNIDLVYQYCYPLKKGDQSDGSVKVIKVREDCCPICGTKLVDVLTIDGNDKRLVFLGLGGKVCIPICLSCAVMCEKTIVRYTVNGESSMEIVKHFGEEYPLSEGELNKLASNSLSLSKTMEPIYYACGFEDTCTIGGHADWIQDWQYELCPDCGKKMKLLSALAWDELMVGYEGTLYIEICTDCHVITAFHQQT